MNILQKGKKGAAKLGSGALNLLKGTLKNMGPEATKKRYAEMDASSAEKRADLIRENFGNEERYRQVSDPDNPLFETTTTKVARGLAKGGKKIGKGLGSFVERLANARKTAAEVAGKAGTKIKNIID